MGRYRDAMEQELLLQGYSDRTREAYVYCVREQLRFCRSEPEKVDPDTVRSYLLYLANKPVSWSFFNQSVCALRFFYGKVLHRDWTVERIPFQRKGRRLPEILSVEEVARLIEAAGGLRERALLELAYGCGLRLGRSDTSRSPTSTASAW